MLWVVLFGVGMRGLVGMSVEGDYLAYILPGVIALSALSGAVGGGMGLLDERLCGIVKEYLAAPIPRLSILIGNAASTATKALIQSLLILLVGLMMGTQLSLNPLGWLAAAVLLVLFTVGSAGIALAIAAVSRSIQGYHGMIFLFNLPMLFASNALYPLEVLPGWMRVVVLLNPAGYLIAGLLLLAFGRITTLSPWRSLLVIGAFACRGIAPAYRLVQRSIAVGTARTGVDAPHTAAPLSSAAKAANARVFCSA